LVAVERRGTRGLRNPDFDLTAAVRSSYGRPAEIVHKAHRSPSLARSASLPDIEGDAATVGLIIAIAALLSTRPPDDA
jgi:hypothetical protein